MFFPAIRQTLIATAFIFASIFGETPGFAQTEQANGAKIIGNALFITFQVAGCKYTLPTSVNVFAVVTGSCSAHGPDGSMNGFVRDVRGITEVFSPEPGSDTRPIGINAQGAITGSYTLSGHTHGFVRSPSGTITSFDFPGSSATYPSAINAQGVITGSFFFGDLTPHGFVRAADGTLTAFDFLIPSKGTTPMAINDEGAITGSYFLPISDIPAGFLRSAPGVLTSFRPGAFGTVPFGINRPGNIAGIAFVTSADVTPHGFLLLADGTVTLFDYPGKVNLTPLIFQSRSTSGISGGINGKNEITGTYLDPNGDSHGFVRLPDGTIQTFALGPGDTTAQSINDFGVVTGNYSVSAAKSVGYLRAPL